MLIFAGAKTDTTFSTLTHGGSKKIVGGIVEKYEMCQFETKEFSKMCRFISPIPLPDHYLNFELITAVLGIVT